MCLELFAWEERPEIRNKVTTLLSRAARWKGRVLQAWVRPRVLGVLGALGVEPGPGKHGDPGEEVSTLALRARPGQPGEDILAGTRAHPRREMLSSPTLFWSPF